MFHGTSVLYLLLQCHCMLVDPFCLSVLVPTNASLNSPLVATFLRGSDSALVTASSGSLSLVLVHFVQILHNAL